MNEFYKFVEPYLANQYSDWEDEFKASFSQKGKKMFRKLGQRLNLDPLVVSYNRAGVACSGDLLLMGMRGNVGIYVSLNLDGLRPGVLYRTIKHIKDYTGGGNCYFSLSDFVIKNKVYKILDSHLGVKNEPWIKY